MGDPKKRVISQEILPEKTDEQIAAEEGKKVKDFFIDIQKQRQAKLKEKSYFYILRDQLRQKVEAHKKKMLEVLSHRHYQTMTAPSWSHMM